MLARLCLAMTILAALVLASCRAESPATSTAEPPLATATPMLRSFRTQVPIDAHMMAQLIGQLRIVDGCLWVIGNNRMQYPIVWPYGYSWDEDDGTVHVRDENGMVVTKVGVLIQMAGGEVDGEPTLDPCLTTTKAWYAVDPAVVVPGR